MQGRSRSPSILGQAMARRSSLSFSVASSTPAALKTTWEYSTRGGARATGKAALRSSDGASERVDLHRMGGLAALGMTLTSCCKVAAEAGRPPGHRRLTASAPATTHAATARIGADDRKSGANERIVRSVPITFALQSRWPEMISLQFNRCML